jgi:hypothetical protein
VPVTVEQAAWFAERRIKREFLGMTLEIVDLDRDEAARVALDMRLTGKAMTGPGKIGAAADRIVATWRGRQAGFRCCCSVLSA